MPEIDNDLRNYRKHLIAKHGSMTGVLFASMHGKLEFDSKWDQYGWNQETVIQIALIEQLDRIAHALEAQHTK